MTLVDTTYRYCAVNDTYCRVLGRSRDELLGRTIAEVWGEEAFRDRIKPHFDACFAGREVHYESWFKVGSLGLRCFDVAYFPHRNAEGAVVQAVVSTHDITHLKDVERELRESEAKYRSLFYHSTDGIFLHDKEGRLVDANAKFFERFGYDREELENLTLADLQPPDTLLLSDPAFQPVYYHGVESIEVVFRTKSGETFPAEISSATLPVGEQPLVQCIVRDVTDRKRTQEALRESEQWFRRLVEHAADAFFLLDPSGRIVDVNQRACDSLGYDREELHWMQIWDVDTGTTPERFAVFADELGGGNPVTLESTYRRKDGTSFPVEARYGVFESSGRRLLLALARDVSDRKKAEEALRQRDDQLRQAQKMESIGRLAGGVAHDFNNLLMAIMGFAENALSDTPPTDPRHENLQQVIQVSQRAAALTRQLLAFSRRQVLQPKVMAINGVVSNLEKMLRRLIGEDVQLHTALDPEAGLVKADPGQLEQVIMNLVVNARDAMAHGGRITIESGNAEIDRAYAGRHDQTAPGRYIRLAVSDTGCGMTPEVQSRIFEPFFTTKEKGKGTGLGLATVYGIIKQSGGHIIVYSEVGKGTTFKIYLPRHQPDGAGHAEGAETRTAMGGTETILLVEDDQAVRTLIRGTLERRGYRVLEAPDGEGGLWASQRHEGPIHLMITDVVMPHISGPELAQRLAERRPEMKVLFMSGYADEAVVHHGLLSSGKRFLQKPIPSDILTSKVREMLDTK